MRVFIHTTVALIGFRGTVMGAATLTAVAITMFAVFSLILLHIFISATVTLVGAAILTALLMTGFSFIPKVKVFAFVAKGVRGAVSLW
ncbi:hypothetical protein [Lentibacillus persicus]|uniref:hypothetical protein n=1 Tax=Lentibacillus persicus TaxID=640948 RepID=UPI001FDEC578|nr:hypothetical protein [Lentibacillus persicus]